MNLWEFIYPMKRITKPIRLIELFAGIGSQLWVGTSLYKIVQERGSFYDFLSLCACSSISAIPFT